MKILRFSILVLLLVAGAVLIVGSPGSAENGGSPATESAVGSAAGTGSQAEEGSDDDPGPPLDTFVPTKRLPADSAISFPVDI